MSGLLVPAEVVRMNLDANGEAGRAWLAELPWIVGELRERWSLTAMGPAFEGGCVGFVAPVERADETRAVIKISYVDDETHHEGDALAFWDGDGAVRLLDADPGLGALLLERLEPGTSLFDHPNPGEVVPLACGVLRRLWRPPSEVHPFALVRDLAERWADELPRLFERFGRPFEARLADEAAGLSADLAADTNEPVLANRDFHPGNVLAAQREPWLAIDPKPLVGERAFDTGHLLRSLLPEKLEPALVRRLVDRLADELELDPERIRAWSLVRSVEDSLWSLGLGRDDTGWLDIHRDVEIARVLSGIRYARRP